MPKYHFYKPGLSSKIEPFMKFDKVELTLCRFSQRPAKSTTPTPVTFPLLKTLSEEKCFLDRRTVEQYR